MWVGEFRLLRHRRNRGTRLTHLIVMEGTLPPPMVIASACELEGDVAEHGETDRERKELHILHTLTGRSLLGSGIKARLLV